LVRDVRAAPSDPRAGVFDETSGRRTLPRSEVRPPARWFGRAVVLRHGTLELPVELQLHFEDGSQETRAWDGVGTRYELSYTGPSKLVGVTVDPRTRVLLDDDLTNNAASNVERDTPRIFERLLYVSELLLAGGVP
jgi:hypothetical protein